MAYRARGGKIPKREMRFYMTWTASLDMDEASKTRIGQCLYWYIKNANVNKFCFYLTAMLSMALSASIPVINGWPRAGGLVSVFAAVSAFAVGLSSLFSFKEKWNRNRCTAEKIKRELALFKAGAGDYGGEDPQTVLIMVTEALFADDMDAWRCAMQKEGPVEQEEPEKE